MVLRREENGRHNHGHSRVHQGVEKVGDHEDLRDTTAQISAAVVFAVLVTLGANIQEHQNWLVVNEEANQRVVPASENGWSHRPPQHSQSEQARLHILWAEEGKGKTLPQNARICGSLSVSRRRQGATKHALDAQDHHHHRSLCAC